MLCMPSHRDWVTIAIATLNEMSRKKHTSVWTLVFIIYNQLWIKQALIQCFAQSTFNVYAIQCTYALDYTMYVYAC